MKAQCLCARWQREMSAREIVLDRRAVGVDCFVPDCAREMIGALRLVDNALASLALVEQPTPAQLVEHVARIATGEAMNQQAALTVANRERGLAVMVAWAGDQIIAAPCLDALAAERGGDLGGGHDAVLRKHAGMSSGWDGSACVRSYAAGSMEVARGYCGPLLTGRWNQKGTLSRGCPCCWKVHDSTARPCAPFVGRASSRRRAPGRWRRRSSQSGAAPAPARAG